MSKADDLLLKMQQDAKYMGIVFDDVVSFHSYAKKLEAQIARQKARIAELIEDNDRFAIESCSRPCSMRTLIDPKHCQVDRFTPDDAPNRSPQ